MPELKEYKLDDIIETLIDYRGKTPPKTTSGIPLVTAKIIKGGKILQPNEFISANFYDEWMTRGLPKRGDLLLTTEAPLGEVAQIEDENIALAQRIILLRGKPGICNTSFLKYYFLSPEGSNVLQSKATGTTVEGIKQSTLRQININLPDYDTQCVIAEVLTSLDKKIDLLNRYNKTLEELAQSFFRQWFLVENANDPIFVSDIATLENNSMNPGRQPLEPFYHYSIPAFDNAQTPVIELGKAILSNKYCVLPNTILVSKLNPITPRIWRIGEDVQSNSVCSTEFQVLKPKEFQYYLYLYYLMKSNDVVGSFSMSATGTSGSHQRIRPEYILEVETPAPNEEKLALFNKVCSPMMEQVKKNQKQILILQKLLDTLLPKLISGEVCVKQHEVTING